MKKVFFYIFCLISIILVSVLFARMTASSDNVKFVYYKDKYTSILSDEELEEYKRFLNEDLVVFEKLDNTVVKGKTKFSKRDYVLLGAIMNGTVKADNNGNENTYYKIGGAFVEGWKNDENGDWKYYIPNIKNPFMFLPDKIKNSWILIDNKWYDFESDGRLKQIVGWKEYNGKWAYHLPHDYGAVSNSFLHLDNKWYVFDKDGYLIHESKEKPKSEDFKKN